MKVLMVSLDYPPTAGGIAAHVYELSHAIKEQGHKISVVTLNVKNQWKKYENDNGIGIYRISLKGIGLTYGFEINKYIKKYIKEKGTPDIIHIHGMRPLEFYNIPNIPLVYTNHTSGFLKRVQKGGYRVWVMKKFLNKPNLILAPSKELLDIPFKVQAEKVFISNGVVSQKFKRDDEKRKKLRLDLNYSDTDIVAIVTRRMVWKNGVEFLAKATQYIQNKKLKILFIGDGEEKGKIVQHLEKYFQGRYTMLGEKTHQEIIEYYSVADLSILPSLMEATSISGLEAMAASLPLIGTKVGGIPVLLQDGINGYLCEPSNPEDLAEKIDMLLEVNYKILGENSKILVEEKFDWSMIAKKTIEAYRNMEKNNKYV